MKQDDVVVSGIAGIKGEEKEPGIIIKLLATGENVSLSLLEAQPRQELRGPRPLRRKNSVISTREEVS